jgi:hypothetical protein
LLKKPTSLRPVPRLLYFSARVQFGHAPFIFHFDRCAADLR